jgi:hypothetical protein
MAIRGKLDSVPVVDGELVAGLGLCSVLLAFELGLAHKELDAA